MKVLVIEDDAKIASFVARGLGEAGFSVDVAADGGEGLDRVLVHEYDVVVVDLMLPVMDGLAVIEKMRAEGVRVPVIILSAKGRVSDRVQGLQAGGDDYLTKPFSFSELLARVQALIRRSGGGAGGGDGDGGGAVLRAGDLELDRWRREVRCGGEVVALHAREFALLELLMRNAGRVVSKAAILENVYDYSFDPQTNVVDVLVHRLRKKLDAGDGKKRIETKRGMGYVLRTDG